MVERRCSGERGFMLRPVEDRAAGAGDLVAINLQFDAGRDDRALPMIGLEFIGFDALNGVAPVSDSDARVLRDVREVLGSAATVSRRFGVSLLHDAIGLKDLEVLLETCDPLHPRAALHRGRSRRPTASARGVETSWSWSAPAEAEAMDALAL